MALRASAQFSGQEVDVHAITEGNVADSGVDHGAELVAFAEAIVGTDDAALERARKELLRAAGPEALVDAAAVAGNFQRMVRIADGTGIPLDGALDVMSVDLRDELDLRRFGSAAHTPEASRLRRTLRPGLQLLGKLVLKLMVWRNRPKRAPG